MILIVYLKRFATQVLFGFFSKMKQSTGGRDETVSKSTINKTNRKVTNKSRHRSSKPNITSNKASDVSSENINLIKTTSAGITCKTSKLNSPSGSAAGLFHNVTTGEINTFNQQSYSNDSTASIAIGTSTGIKQEVSQGYLGSNCDENAMTGHSGDNILFTKSKVILMKKKMMEIIKILFCRVIPKIMLA